VAPSAIPFNDGDPIPHALTKEEIKALTQAFVAAAKRALKAGFEVLELHAAHGYLMHEFLSPLSNHRTDEYGGSFENRARFVIEVTEAVRKVWPENLPLFVRISATDWVEGGWDEKQSIALAKILKTKGVDLIDCSSGAMVPNAKIPTGPGYQVPFAEHIKKEAGIATGAVGMITKPEQAEEIIAKGQADIVLLARAELHDPYWALHAAEVLLGEAKPPVQYTYGFLKKR
jgi:2,4-dienoyl-CoA reductase-like NADH-dependent reductase (Old Yellow Enzyme family)